MKKISIMAVLFAAATAFGLDSPDAQIKVKDKFALAPKGAVEMKGVLGDELDTSLKGDILVWDIDDLVRPFKLRQEERLWQIEFWGKWYTSAQLAYDFYPSAALDKRLKYAANELIKTQDAEGSITTYKKDHEFKFNKTGGLGNAFASWDVWGRKYVLLGLMNEYNRTSDKKVLEAAKKHADYIIKNVGPGKREIVQIGCWYGLASSSILEPMVLLYRATADKKYLDFCEWIVKSWETNPVKPDLVNKAIKGVSVYDMFQHPDAVEDKNNYMSYGHSKAYEMMSCYEGLTELYRVTGNPIYREAVEKVIRSIREREITVLGSAAMHERWNDGAFEQQRVNPYWMETCVTATWIKFATQLLRLTGDVTFANDIETTAYNSMIAAQNHDGTWWAHYNTMSGVRKPAPEQCNIHMNCCVASGPRGLFLLPKLAFMTCEGGVVVNFYEKGGATMNVNDGSVDISVSDVDFVSNNTARISINGLKGGKERFTLKLRIPEWSKNTLVIVNGKKLPTPEAGKYLSIDRTFNNGDEIFITFDVKTRAVVDPKNDKFYVLKHGPYVLALDRKFDKDFDKPAKVKLEKGVANGTIVNLKDVNIAIDVEMEDGSTRRFVDYASAGATWDKDSEFKIWLEK